MTSLSESPKPARLAILSFIFGLVSWLMWCLLYSTPGIMSENNTLDEGAGYIGFILGPIVLGLITLGLGIAGATLGIQAIRKKDPKRGLASLGLVLNFICLCPFILLVIGMLAAGVGGIPDFIQQIIASFGS